jgi:hypothetical protein
MIAKEGTSAEQMHLLQDRVDEVLRADENNLATFTITGSEWIPRIESGLRAGVSHATGRPRTDRNTSRAC